MKRAAGLLLAGGFTAYLIVGVPKVPFHPDETSLLLQSGDLERYAQDPRSLAWNAELQNDPEQSYRVLNAPLPKYVLGLGRAIAGFPAVTTDWDWSQSWNQNLERGALPMTEILTSARAASTLLLPVGLYLLYRSGDRLGGPVVGWIAALLLGLNPLFLLHGRRAMAEGTLLFGVCLGVWAILRADRRPLLAGMAIAVAVGAKYSALPLLVIGLLATVGPRERKAGASARLGAVASFLTGALLLGLILNPLVWSDPVPATLEIWTARGSLVQDQIQSQLIAEHVAVELPLSPTDRISAFLSQVFFAPPQFQEAGNYRAEIKTSIEAYLAMPGHSLLRGWLAGGLHLGLALAGFAFALVDLRSVDGAARRDRMLLLAAATAVGLTLIVGVPFPFQRYYIPMIPLTSLLAAYALGGMHALSKKWLSQKP